MRKEVMQMALEALENSSDVIFQNVTKSALRGIAITALREALAVAQPEQEPVAKKMTAHRAVYFMERFKHEEKLLGPNEQAALDFVIALLESQPEQQHARDAITWTPETGYVFAPAQPEQEPVAWINWSALTGERRLGWQCESEIASEPLYTAPQPARQPLTHDEISKIYIAWDETPGTSWADFARAIEAAHGIKEQP